jgi:hypothetical protein
MSRAERGKLTRSVLQRKLPPIRGRYERSLKVPRFLAKIARADVLQTVRKVGVFRAEPREGWDAEILAILG